MLRTSSLFCSVRKANLAALASSFFNAQGRFQIYQKRLWSFGASALQCCYVASTRPTSGPSQCNFGAEGQRSGPSRCMGVIQHFLWKRRIESTLKAHFTKSCPRRPCKSAGDLSGGRMWSFDQGDLRNTRARSIKSRECVRSDADVRAFVTVVSRDQADCRTSRAENAITLPRSRNVIRLGLGLGLY